MSDDPVTRLNAALEGRYAIERELGEGGMATVSLADDLKHQRKVALKVLKPELAGGDVLTPGTGVHLRSENGPEFTVHAVSTPEKHRMSLEVQPSPRAGRGPANGWASPPVVGPSSWVSSSRLSLRRTIFAFWTVVIFSPVLVEQL